jgi:hypothetical protein
MDSESLKIDCKGQKPLDWNVPYMIGKLLERICLKWACITHSDTSNTKLWPPKSWKSQFWEFRDSQMGVLGQNDIWVLILWPSTEYTIRGKVVASPKSGPWSILWVRVCPWLVRAPKALKLHTNQLVVWFVQVRVNNWCLSLFLVPIPELQHALLSPKCCEVRSVPQLFTLSLFSPHTHIWVYQGAWGCVNFVLFICF